MTQSNRPTLAYETAGTDRRPGRAVATTMIICGTALMIAPWLAFAMGGSTFTFAGARMFPLTWIDTGVGMAMIWLGYFRSER